MKTTFLCGGLMALAVLASCTKSQDNAGYTLTYTSDQNTEGNWALLENFAGDTIASGTFSDSMFETSGPIDEPTLAVLWINDRPSAYAVLENGNIALNDTAVTGTPSNDAYMTLMAEAQKEGADQYEILKEFVVNNPENPFAPMMSVYVWDELTIAQIDTLMAHFPTFAQSEQIIGMREKKVNAEKTSEGNKFIDFEVDGTKLSDYINDSDLTIVDFWAPWCGPCRAEMPNLQELYAKYHAKGLNVVGVDVWQREGFSAPEVIQSMGITYPIMYGVPDEVTDTYGVNAIPTILVIDSEGTILARNLRGDELAAFIASRFPAE